MKTMSEHYTKSRKIREAIIQNFLNGDGVIIDGFIVDRHHANGAEVHSITDKGIILIHNYNTGVLCTKLIARPAQIKRYYNYFKRPYPEGFADLIRLCWNHSVIGLNHF